MDVPNNMKDKVMLALTVCQGYRLCDPDHCPYGDKVDGHECLDSLHEDALALLKAQEPADYIPIDWLMNYAQLPTEFAISEWRKPKKEAEIKQAKSLDKRMSLDDALELLKRRGQCW